MFNYGVKIIFNSIIKKVKFKIKKLRNNFEL